MTLSAVLVVLSAAGRLQPQNYSLPGPCPEPPPSTQLFEGPPLSTAYTAAMRFDSDPVATQALNCMHLYFPQKDARLLLSDCGDYEGLLQNQSQQFSVALRLLDVSSACLNYTHPPMQLSLWTDRRKELLLIWSCTADKERRTHRQVATVFIGLNYFVRSLETQESGAALVQRVGVFAEDRLAFAGLHRDQFEVNRKLLEEGAVETQCSFKNCTWQCPPGASAGYADLLLLLLLFGVVALLLCLLLV